MEAEEEINSEKDVEDLIVVEVETLEVEIEDSVDDGNDNYLILLI